MLNVCGCTEPLPLDMHGQPNRFGQSSLNEPLCGTSNSAWVEPTILREMMRKNSGCSGLELGSRITVVFKYRIRPRFYQRAHLVAVIVSQNLAGEHASHQ